MEKTRFVCQNCGYVSLKWLGRCPECGNWESLCEERIKPFRATVSHSPSPFPPQTVNQISISHQKRYRTNIGEFDRILGGGIVPGSLILVGGEPGIGKSTLLLDVGNKLSSQGHSVLYISGEESAQQTKLRAVRLDINSPNLLILAETNLSLISEQIEKIKPEVVIVDSIQSVYLEELGSTPGSISQIRESTTHLMRIAKGKGITIFLIGHVTKRGVLAGPRVLEHMVDTVLYFETSSDYQYRILRTTKNRFGPTSEIGIFMMRENGLEEVLDSSKFFLHTSLHNSPTPGTVVMPTMEGSRPFLVEIQALVTVSNLNLPRRISQGIEHNRLCLLLAVLEKQGKIPFYNRDVFLNVAGGIRINDPACDLPIILAIVSSLWERPIQKGLVAIGEVGVGGEIRPVAFMEKRIKDAVKLGYSRCLTFPSYSKSIKNPGKIKIIGIPGVGEAIKNGLREKVG